MYTSNSSENTNADASYGLSPPQLVTLNMQSSCIFYKKQFPEAFLQSKLQLFLAKLAGGGFVRIYD